MDALERWPCNLDRGRGWAEGERGSTKGEAEHVLYDYSVVHIWAVDGSVHRGE